ncbi:D-alanyl-D-alanine carboxypeptidase/D-alanyl-D-alanine-endopeptidase [Crocinitomicaceae bacterium]|nr:D-alanyl-D-alanine carboxypeptidase/D-alanyl-D-alanine-endopeptidase [Crocinitomicaceae bacterium]MDB3905963.1 D-alanyl-D-alanine carboxypeptidase/D-alanyl-D-alanine-endopeptidase [Crocinitomicaceae bacterium]
MKIVSSLLLILLLISNFAFSQQSLTNAVSTFTNGSGMEHASVSIEIYDLDSKTTVASHNTNLTLPTASTAKLFSTATALEILGPDYRAKTRLYVEGYVEDGKLIGNLWIRGSGDPSLGSKYFNSPGHELDFMKPWIDSLKSMGITSISGGVIGDGSEFGYEGAPDGWNWVDMGNYYGAGPSGLTIYDNLVRYTFTSGSTPGMVVKVKSIEPEVPGLIYHNYVKSSKRSGDNAYLYGGPYAFDRFGSGTIPINKSAFLVKGSLPDPELQCAHELTELLQSNGIDVMEEPHGCRSMEVFSKSTDYDKRTLVATHEGESLQAIIKETNHRSVNLFAEHMLNLIGYEETGNGSTASGIGVFEKHWNAKINTSGLHLNDGSGLSRSNAISAHHFVQFLEAMNTSSQKDAFRKSLPVAGESGTMKYVCRNTAGHGRIAAKSGSMTRIKSYSGYVDSKTGKHYAFAIIVNNYSGSSSSLKTKFQALMNAISVN